MAFLRSETEKTNKFKYRRSYHYAESYRSGTVIDMGKLTLVRPGDGITGEELQSVIGKKLNKDVQYFDACFISDFE